MLKTLIAGGIAALAMVATVPTASAFQRSVTIEGPRGTTTHTVDRYCFDGACYSEGQITGPYGGSLKTSGMCTRTAPYEWDCKGTVTGPEGGTITREGHVVVTY